MPHKLHAAIHLGAHNVRLIVAEQRGQQGYRTLENLQVPLLLGQQTFAKGRIGHDGIQGTCRILNRFKTVIESYKIKSFTTVATSAVREANNCDTFIDRVMQATGIRIEVIEPIEETRLVHRLVRHIIGERFKMNKGTTMILSLGGGGSQIIVFRDGEVVFSESRKVGTVRLRQFLSSDRRQLGEDLDLFVTNVAQTFRQIHDLGAIDTFITINNSLCDYLPQFAKTSPYNKVFTIARDETEGLLDHIVDRNQLELQAEFKIAADELDTFLVALTQAQAFLEITNAKRLIVPEVTFIDALMIDEIVGAKEANVEAFSQQVEAATIHLGRRYHFHEKHALFVRDMAYKIFDGLQEYHGMEARDRLHLGVAALLHDIGWFVSAQSHHKHAMYIINASEILGLDAEDRQIVGLVARYHRKALPRASQPEFMNLSPKTRSRVVKMSSLLRIADALDRDLSQSIRGLKVEITDEAILLKFDIPSSKQGLLNLLDRAVSNKAALFEETFGTPIRVCLRDNASY